MMTLSSLYHSKTDGQTEIVDRMLEELILAYVDFDKLNLDLYLTHFEAAYKFSNHTFSSFTLVYLNYGKLPRIIVLITLDFLNPFAEDFLSHMQK